MGVSPQFVTIDRFAGSAVPCEANAIDFSGGVRCQNSFLLVTVSILILAFAASAGAQPGPIGQNFLVKAKPGQELPWEAADKEHLEWHSDMTDSWGWVTYQMMSGPRVGEYFVRTGGQVYGGMEAAGIFAEFWSCADSLESYIAICRDDLSYEAPETTSNE